MRDTKVDGHVCLIQLEKSASKRIRLIQKLHKDATLFTSEENYFCYFLWGKQRLIDAFMNDLSKGDISVFLSAERRPAHTSIPPAIVRRGVPPGGGGGGVVGEEANDVAWTWQPSVSVPEMHC